MRSFLSLPLSLVELHLVLDDGRLCVRILIRVFLFAQFLAKVRKLTIVESLKVTSDLVDGGRAVVVEVLLGILAKEFLQLEKLSLLHLEVHGQLLLQV